MGFFSKWLDSIATCIMKLLHNIYLIGYQYKLFYRNVMGAFSITKLRYRKSVMWRSYSIEKMCKSNLIEAAGVIVRVVTWINANYMYMKAKCSLWENCIPLLKKTKTFSTLCKWVCILCLLMGIVWHTGNMKTSTVSHRMVRFYEIPWTVLRAQYILDKRSSWFSDNQ